MRIIVIFLMLLFCCNAVSQVGINTTNPNALLDIRSSSESNPSITDGILIPKISVFPSSNPSAAQQGMLVYLTTLSGSNPPGFYNWDFGTLSWLPLGGSSGGGTLDDAYDFGGAGLGRNIISDAGAVLISGTDGLQVTGTYGSGENLALSGAGTRMFFYPKKSAFRAGTVNTAQWNDASIGNYSTAFGHRTLANADYATAFADQSTATGTRSFAWGYAGWATGITATAWGMQTTAEGELSTAWGRLTVASGIHSTAWGTYSEAQVALTTAWGNVAVARGYNSTAFGNNVTAYSNYETAIGRFNTTYIPTYTTSGSGDWEGTDRIFVIGNGTASFERSDAMVVLKNGNTGLGISAPSYRLELSTDSAGKPGTSIWTVTSDERLKNVTGQYEKGLEEIIQLNTVTYKYKNQNNSRFDSETLNTEFSGFLAQDVKEIFPEAVHTDAKGYLQLNMHPIFISYVNAIKTLYEENVKLSSEVQQLKDMYNELKMKIEILEKK